VFRRREGEGRSAVGPAPQAFDHNRLQRLVAVARPASVASQSPHAAERFDRLATRKTIALDRPSVFLLLRGTIFGWWRAPPEGNPAFFALRRLP